MKRNSMKNRLSLVLCVVLVAALALFAAGCTDSFIPDGPTDPTEPHASDLPMTVLGEGATSFSFSVVDPEGNQTWYEIRTDETVVGAALMALELIDGDPGPYGLYVKTVGGITLDYERDGKYWAFYVDGEYGITGVDETDIVPGTMYTFKAE